MLALVLAKIQLVIVPYPKWTTLGVWHHSTKKEQREGVKRKMGGQMEEQEEGGSEGKGEKKKGKERRKGRKGIFMSLPYPSDSQMYPESDPF